MAKGISDEFLETLKSKNDIVDIASRYMTLTRRGGNFWACCPFHSEKTPSFSIKHENQFYKCFGCGESGNVINLVMKLENVDFLTAVDMLAKNAGLTLPSDTENEEMKLKKIKRDKIYKILTATTEFYHNNLINNPNSKQAEYLKKRRLTPEIIKKFKIGISLDYNSLPKHLKDLGFSVEDCIMAGVLGRDEYGKTYDFYGTRLIFPIFNGFGDTVAYSGRSVEDNPTHTKYKNTSQTLVFNKSETLFAFNFVRELKKEHMLDTIIIVEGHIDVIACHQYGITNTVGTMGTALTTLHAKRLKQLVDNVVLCLDGDNAGEQATYKAIDILKEVGLNVKVVRLTGAKDPDEYLHKYGVNSFREMLVAAQDCVDFVLTDSAKRYNLNNNADKNNYVSEALNYISKFTTPAEQEIYLKLVQNIVKIPIDALRQSLKRADTPSQKMQQAEQDMHETSSNNYILESKIMLLSSILYKKLKNFEEIAGIFTDDDELSGLYRFICQKVSEGKDFNISTLFDNFEIANNSLIDRVINYKFPPEDVFEVYLQETIKRVKKLDFERKREELKAKMLTSKNLDEQFYYLNQIQQLEQKLKEIK